MRGARNGRGHWLGGLALAAGLLLPTGALQAQLPFTVVAGPTFASIATDEYDTSSKVGFFAGIGTAFPLGERATVSPYVSYVRKGAKFDDVDGEDTYTYIEIPILVGTNFPVGEGGASVGVSLGPQVSFNIECTETFSTGEENDCKEFTDYAGSTDFGLVGSVGLSFPAGNSTLSVGGGFDYGLKDMFEDLDGGYKNRSFFLFVGWGTALGM